MIAQVLVSAIATMAFAVLFQAPPRHYIRCGLVGAAGYLVFLLLVRGNASPALACFCAAVMLTVLARFAGVLYRTPVTIFLLAGIFPLVPGAGIYYTAYYLFSGNGAMASAKGLETLLFAGAISLGILFGSALPQWCFDKMVSLGKRRGRNK